jgi:MraZ protein
MFRGRFEHTVDNKGRVSLPARFREIISSRYSEDRLILTSFTEPCLIAYPVAEWQLVEDRFRKLPHFDPKLLRLKRVLISGAQECQIDSNGRVLIPPVLREYAKLERDVVWTGMVEWIELWSKETWERVSQEDRGQLENMSDVLGEIGL